MVAAEPKPEPLEPAEPAISAARDFPMPTSAEADAPDAPTVAAMGDETLYRGHKGPGVGRLAAEIPERPDGDKDTVAAERWPRKGDAYLISPEPVPQRLRERVIADLNRDHLRVLAQAQYSREEKKKVKDLFNGERRAVAAGKDRQPFIAESEGLTAEARKRGPRMPSDASMAYAATVREPSVRRPRDRNRNRDAKKTGMTGLPGVVARTR